jgi:hypothetical protein
MLLLVTNSVVFRDVWGGGGRWRDEKVSCDCAKVPFFSSHIFSQASQNNRVRVNVRVDRNVRRKNSR